MSRGIFDSSILIDCLRGRPDAVSILAAQSAGTRPSTKKDAGHTFRRACVCDFCEMT